MDSKIMKLQLIILIINHSVFSANIPSNTVGTLFYDTFDDQSQWVPKTNHTPKTEILNNIQGSNNVLHFTAAVGGGDIFTKDSFSKPNNHNQFWYFMDYLDVGPQNTDCLIYAGAASSYSGVGQWVLTGEGSTYTIPKYQGSQTWDHYELLITPNYNPFYISIEDNTGVTKGCYVDNLMITSFHGPDTIRVDPYNNIIEGFEVLSVDYTGYTSTSESQFNFDVATVNGLLGRASNSALNGEKFAIYIPAQDLVEEVLLYSTSNGGSIGNGYGRFVNNSYGSNQQFNPGDYLFFDQNLSTSKTSYVKYDGTCMYDGPFRSYEYDTCFDNCKDYSTLLEASYYCQMEKECLGITFSHKYWGGSSSTGHFYEGYGYQLRKGNLVQKSDRKFVHSWTKNSGNYIQLNPSQECTECKFGCNGCYKLQDNCLQCIGSNRVLPACSCPIGFYDDGVSADCQPCDNKCAQCENQYNEYNHLITFGPIHYHLGHELKSSVQDNFGQTGTVYQVNAMVRIGISTQNEIPTLHMNEKYQFCVWLKIAPGSSITSSTSFSLDIGDTINRRYITDKYGTIIDMFNQNQLSPYLSSTEWNRFCVNAQRTTNEHYNFIDIGKYGDSSVIFYYANPQLVKVYSKDAQPVPHIVGKSNDGTCQFCAHHTRIGSKCECSPGYYQSLSDPTMCESPKPSECDYYIRIESGGWLPNSPNTGDSRGNIYLNDVKFGQDPARGFNFYVLNDQFGLESQQAFDTYNNSQDVLDMITFINGLPQGKIVLVLIYDEGSKKLTTDAYTALQSLGVNQYTKFEFRDSFAMIGRKGAAPGTVKQVIGKQISKGTANLVGCLRCSSSCFQCIDIFDQFPVIQGQHSYQIPVLKPSVQDYKGNTGTVYEVTPIGPSNIKSKLRFGKAGLNDFPLDQIHKGQIYQFSVWLRKKSGQIQDKFELDIVDRSYARYISDENGSIIKILNTDHILADDALTEQWQRFVVNAVHDNQEQFHFIDLGTILDFEFEFSHPQLYEIPDVNYPPVKQQDTNSPQNGCFKCLHYARQPNDCLCSAGYTETNAGETECSSPIPSTCSKYVRIESAGTNYSQYDPGNYLRIYMNDVEYGTFSRGITLIVLNEQTFATISTNTYDSGDTNFDPTNLISDINGIPNGRYVLVGIKDDGSQNLNAATYTALQSLGLSSSTVLNYRDSLAMIGIKGATQGSVIQQHSIMLNGSKSNVVDCLLGCDHQCATCSNEPNSCDSCSHLTRDLNDSCNCKPTFYNNNTDAECKACVSPCINCTSSTDCTSCIDGYYLDGTTCKVCDNSTCATCQTNATTCINSCNSDCKTCLVDQTCDSCDDGYFLQSGSCIQCDHTICATCSGNTDSNDCILQCNSTCKTCDSTSNCVTCDDGYYLDGNICKVCDNSTCATCQTNATTCINSCNSDCKTCLVDQTCDSCNDGYFLQNGSCIQCDHTICATCNGNTDSNDCILQCNSTCKTCDTSSDCVTCEDGYYLDAQTKTCKICDDTKCALCQTQDDNCNLPCNSTCKRCNIDGTCSHCEIGQFLQSSDSSCQSCDNTVCATCNTNSTNCELTCGVTCKTCNTDQTCLSCEDGKYLRDSDKTCQPCDNSICGTCQTENNQCIIPCGDSCLTCNIQGYCLTCEDGYFIDGNQCSPCDNTVCGTCVTSNNNCIQQCHNSCETCNTQGECLTCENGKFVDSSQSNICSDCSYQCKTCQNQSDQCIECINNDRDINNNCDCKIGYLDTNTQNPICEKCNVKCGSCSGDVDTCSSCSDISRSMPDCNCSDGYYMNNLGDCLKCKYDCLCTEYGKCTECTGIDKQFKQLPYCSCKNGYFFDNDTQICQKCDPQCKLCQQQSNNCTVCERANFRSQITPSCGCSQSYYSQLTETSDNLECLPCALQCKSCQNGNTCTECLNDKFQLPLCLQEKKGATLTLEVIDNNNEVIQVTQQCKIQCDSCEIEASNCIVCAIGQNRTQKAPECQCEKGYHDMDNTSVDCFKCKSTCLTCLNQRQCSSCNEIQNRELNSINLQCQCKQGFQEDKSGNCVKCYRYKNGCFQQCPANTIQMEDTSQCLEVQLNVQSNTVLVIVCGSILILVQLIVFLLLKKCVGNKFRLLGNQNYSKASQKESPPQSQSGGSENHDIA